jgi:protein TonB
MTAVLARPWPAAIAFSLVTNLLIFGIMAAIAVMEMDEEVEYVAVEMIELPAEQKRVDLPPSAPAPKPEPEIEQKPLPEELPPPVVEKEIGLDKTGEEVVQPPPPEPRTVYHPFHKVSRMPSFKAQVAPVYPASERSLGNEARVIAEVYVNQYGGVDDVKIAKSGGRSFDEAVVRAVMASSFEPAYLEGAPVAVRVRIPYAFKLE